MKVTKQCSECGGREIYTSEGPLGGQSACLLPGITTPIKRPHVEVYVCGNCGFHQMFVKPETLEKVKEKYQRYS